MLIKIEIKRSSPSEKIKHSHAWTIITLVVALVIQNIFLNFKVPYYNTFSAMAEPAAAGTLIRSAERPAVYYVGQDGKKYVFPDAGTYFTWFRNFDSVQTVPQETIDSLADGRIVTAKPGIRPVKVFDSPRVYAVEPGGILRWIPSEEMFYRLGYSFERLTVISDFSFNRYQQGEDLNTVPEGSFVEDNASGLIFYIQDGTKRPVSPEAMQANFYFPHHLLHLSDATLLMPFPEGEPILGREARIARTPDYEEFEISELTPPSDFLAVGGTLNVQLNWTLSESPNIQGYTIYRSTQAFTASNQPGVIVAAVVSNAATGYRDNNLNNSTHYYYGLAAFNESSGTSDLVFSDATTNTLIQIDTTAPNQPTAFTATGGQQQVSLSWSLSSSNDVVIQYLYRSLSPITNPQGNGVTRIAQLSSNATTYVNTGLAANTLFHFALIVQDASGNNSPIVNASAQTLASGDTTAPNAPTAFNATGGQLQASLQWTVSSSNDVANQYLYRSLSPITNPLANGVTQVAQLSATANTYINTGLAANTLYYFALRARDGSGNYSSLATDSAQTDSSTDTTAPNPPGSFSAIGGQGQIQLNWTVSSSNDVANQYLYRSLSPITNPQGNGVIQVAQLSATANTYLNTGLAANTLYYFALQARDAASNNSSLASASATTLEPPLDRILHVPEFPDTYPNPDALPWVMDTVEMAVSLGINKFMVPTRYYQGLNDLDPSYGPQACINHVGRFCSGYHQFLSFVDTLETPDGRPAQVIFLSAKVTKTPMAGSNIQQQGAIRLQNVGETPYNFFSRLSQTSGTLPPSSQGEHRAFITVNFSDAQERDRLLRLTTNVSGESVRIRWYPVGWPDAKFRDTGVGQNGLGLKTFDVPNPTVGANNQYMILIMNTGATPLNWEIQGLEEITPGATEIRNQDATHFEWRGNTAGFTTYAYNHPRYALDETRTRFINTQTTVWNEFSSHPSLIGLMGYGDEPHAMFWMPEDLDRFQNAGHELAEFEKAVASGQYAVTQKPFMLFGDPRDPTHNGISTGVYASNMAGGGFSDMASRFNGSEPIEWVLWEGDRSSSQISGFTSQGFDVYLMDSLYNSSMVTNFNQWTAAANSLSASDKAHVKGWFYYVETRDYVTQARLQEAIGATPDQL